MLLPRTAHAHASHLRVYLHAMTDRPGTWEGIVPVGNQCLLSTMDTPIRVVDCLRRRFRGAACVADVVGRLWLHYGRVTTPTLIDDNLRALTCLTRSNSFRLIKPDARRLVPCYSWLDSLIHTTGCCGSSCHFSCLPGWRYRISLPPRLSQME